MLARYTTARSAHMNGYRKNLRSSFRYYKTVVSAMLMETTMHGSFTHPRTVLVYAALIDVWNEIFMTMPAEALCIDVMIIPLTSGVFVQLACEMIDFGVDMLTGVCMIVVLAAASALKVVVPEHPAIDLRAILIMDL